MGLFGPPNVDKMKAKGDVGGLIKALNYENGHGVRKAAAVALVRIGAPAVESLASALYDRNRDVRLAAIEALGAIGDARAVAPLIAALNAILRQRKGCDSQMCRAAAEALGRIGDARAVNSLIAALEAVYSNAQQAAADALVRIGLPAVTPLIAALEAVNSDVQQAAAEALVRLGTPAVEPLAAALNHSNVYVRTRVAGALARFGDTRAVEPLAQLPQFEE